MSAIVLSLIDVWLISAKTVDTKWVHFSFPQTLSLDPSASLSKGPRL